MAEEDESSKTEDPTDRRLAKAREEGDVPLSPEVKNWFAVLAIMTVTWLMAPFMMSQTRDFGLKFISIPEQLPTDANALQHLIADTGLALLKILILPMGLMIVFAFAATISQIGFLFTPKKLEELKWNKLNIFAAAKEFITVRKIVTTLKDIAKITIVAILAYSVIASKLKFIQLLPSMEIMPILKYMQDILVTFFFAVLIAMIVIAGADLAYQRYQHKKKNKMSKQDIKDEYKQTEGDPHVKARIRSIRMEKYRKRMMEKVPNASVVVTNPEHYAVALQYDMETMEAPVLVAKGLDFLALRIRELAEENEVPIVQNPPLARALFASVELDMAIPPEHFKAVAEVISYVMQLKQQIQT